jgi:hypothetical protein
MSGISSPPSPSEPPGLHAFFSFGGCPNPCPGAYLLVVSWAGAPKGGSADVAWSMAAVARYPDISPGGTPQPGAAAITASRAATSPKTADLASLTSGVPIHLTDVDRVRAWTVKLHRATDDVDPHSQNRASWAGQARLELTASQTAGAGFGDGMDPRLAFRSDPPIFLQVVGDGVVQSAQAQSVSTWAGRTPIVFDPFAGCNEGTCDAEFAVEMVWRDGRPDTEFDASWTLDVVSILRDFSGSLGDVEVEPVKPIPLSSATAAGSFEIAAPQLNGQSIFAMELPTLDASTVGAWADLGIPARGRVTARVTLLGGTAPEAEAAFLVSAVGNGYASTGALGGLGTQMALRVGEEGTFTFEPVIRCPKAGTNQCRIDGTISARRQPSNQVKIPADLRLRVDWSIELAAPEGRAPLQIVVGPSPSARP